MGQHSGAPKRAREVGERRRRIRRRRLGLVAGGVAALGILAPAASAAVNTLPLSSPVPGTLGDTGFTTLLTGAQLDASKLAFANGGLAVTSTEGDAYLGFNDQVNALALPVDPGPQGFSARVDVSLPNPSSQTFQSAGVVVGKDQDNYVKLVVSVRPQGASTVAALNFLHEGDGQVKAVSNTALNVPATGRLTLILAVSAAGDVTPQYQVDGGAIQSVAADPCLRGALGCTFAASLPSLLEDGSEAGLITTNYDDVDVPGVTPPFTAEFRNFVLDNPNQVGATPVPPAGGGGGGGGGAAAGPAPKLVALAPGPNGEVARRGRIVMEFNRTVRVPGSAVRLVRGNGIVLPSTSTYVPRLRQIVVTPNRPLPLKGGVFLAISGGANPSAVTSGAGTPLASNLRYKLKVVRTGALPLRGIDLRGRLLDLVLTSNARPRAITARQGATLARTRTNLRVVRRNAKNWTVTLRPASANRYVRVIQRRPGKSPLRTAVFLPR